LGATIALIIFLGATVALIIFCLLLVILCCPMHIYKYICIGCYRTTI
jgi:hypothetical protein